MRIASTALLERVFGKAWHLVDPVLPLVATVYTLQKWQRNVCDMTSPHQAHVTLSQQHHCSKVCIAIITSSPPGVLAVTLAFLLHSRLPYDCCVLLPLSWLVPKYQALAPTPFILPHPVYIALPVNSVFPVWMS